MTVIRCGGNSKPEFRMAERTRSRLSRTVVSGQPDHRERRQAERHVHLHLDWGGLDSKHRGTGQTREHGASTALVSKGGAVWTTGRIARMTVAEGQVLHCQNRCRYAQLLRFERLLESDIRGTEHAIHSPRFGSRDCSEISSGLRHSRTSSSAGTRPRITPPRASTQFEASRQTRNDLDRLNGDIDESSRVTGRGRTAVRPTGWSAGRSRPS